MAPGLVGGEVNAVDEAEEDELDAGSVPEAGEEHGEDGGVGDHGGKAGGGGEGFARDFAAGADAVALHG